MPLERWLYTVPLRLRSLFRRERVEQELEEELQYHLERKMEEYAAQGLTPEQARQAALRAMDRLAQDKEECRDARGVNAIDNTVRDLRYSLRVREITRFHRGRRAYAGAGDGRECRSVRRS